MLSYLILYNITLCFFTNRCWVWFSIECIWSSTSSQRYTHKVNDSNVTIIDTSNSTKATTESFMWQILFCFSSASQIFQFSTLIRFPSSLYFLNILGISNTLLFFSSLLSSYCLISLSSNLLICLKLPNWYILSLLSLLLQNLRIWEMYRTILGLSWEWRWKRFLGPGSHLGVSRIEISTILLVRNSET